MFCLEEMDDERRFFHNWRLLSSKHDSVHAYLKNHVLDSDNELKNTVCAVEQVQRDIKATQKTHADQTKAMQEQDINAVQAQFQQVQGYIKATQKTHADQIQATREQVQQDMRAAQAQVQQDIKVAQAQVQQDIKATKNLHLRLL